MLIGQGQTVNQVNMTYEAQHHVVECTSRARLRILVGSTFFLVSHTGGTHLNFEPKAYERSQFRLSAV
jgi:hypothetical protein